jgi:hypothetical protein
VARKSKGRFKALDDRAEALLRLGADPHDVLKVYEDEGLEHHVAYFRVTSKALALQCEALANAGWTTKGAR